MVTLYMPLAQQAEKGLLKCKKLSVFLLNHLLQLLVLDLKLSELQAQCAGLSCCFSHDLCADQHCIPEEPAASRGLQQTQACLQAQSLMALQGWLKELLLTFQRL